ncbi:DUF3267 domain-containing protein [Bacillus weihaiensis]|uniref:DUF3267 domain-containing protein n=1 Tax=Bacillus weihaiensis TaxID=1547283 RepID=A0A1L3MUP7_9BACI|nr:DUF3267 domain-containing protein [Bacillus weihaiensis]APH06049.1 hypothetical protein A9C19_15600 [Bacillus weihaiensis]
MNCWKTISLSKDVGMYRILFISLLTSIFVFIVTYLPINLLFSKVHLKDGHFLLFILLILCMIPAHKFLHAIPLLLSGCRVSMKINYYFHLPSMQINACKSIKKRQMMLSLMTPFLFFTVLFIAGSLWLPSYMHYFSIAMAIHIGLCVPDFIFTKHVLFAPKLSYIEAFEDGYEILVQK